MRDDLVFHITTRDAWKEFQTNGNYEPESLDSEGFIHCTTGAMLEETANRLFSGEERILLLVIDVSTLGENIKYEKEEETGNTYPHLYAPLSTNAVIDKIDISAEKDGTFNISFTSDS